MKRGSSLVKRYEPSLTADLHSEADLGKICAPVGWKLGFLIVKTCHSPCNVVCISVTPKWRREAEGPLQNKLYRYVPRLSLN